MTTLSLVVAMAENRVIGAGGKIPWRLPVEQQRFRRITMGKPIVMGRKTHESIGRALDGRLNVVLTRNRGWRAPGVVVVHSPQEALDAVGDAPEVMVIGGQAVYEVFLPRADRIHLTLVRCRPQGDAFFPELDPAAWRARQRRSHPPEAANAYPYCTCVLIRRPVTGA